MELLQLRYFQTVAKLGSMTKAAEYHRIPQPAMSQTIARLERELGNIRLFDRLGNHIFLNEKGHLFLKYVDQILVDLDDAVRAITTPSDEISGSISLLVTENRRFIFNCVSDFAKEYPNVNFEISHVPSGDPITRYDLCINSTSSFQQMTSYIPLIREKIILNVNENHWAAGRSSVSLNELREENFITMSATSTLYKITIEQCHAKGYQPHIPFICDDPYFVRKYVAENMGIALAPEISWAGRFRTNTRLIRIGNPSIECMSYLLWDEERYLSPAVRTFKDYVLHRAAEIPENLIEHN